jgi:ABC-type Fe3+ transport system permease subunit
MNELRGGKMKLKDFAIITLVNFIIHFGGGAVKVWVSETAYVIFMISGLIFSIGYLIYYYKKHGTLIQKNDTTE